MGDENDDKGKVITPTFGRGRWTPRVVANNPAPPTDFRAKIKDHVPPPAAPTAREPERFIDEAEEYEAPSEEEMNSPEFLRDAAYIVLNQEVVANFNRRGRELTTFVMDVLMYTGFKKESLDLRRGTFHKHSLEQLVDILLSSEERQWRAKPAWCGAVFIEGHIRQTKFLGSLPKERPDGEDTGE